MGAPPVTLETVITLIGFVVTVAVQAGIMLNQSRAHSQAIGKLADKIDTLMVKVAHLEGQKAARSNVE